jgi:hypothetical protein
MLARRRAAIFSMSSHRTPEWPRIKELIRTRIAPRTQDSGMLVDASGSRRGREGRTSVDEGKTPACWCCNSALPRARVLGVRVSASRRRRDALMSHKSDTGGKDIPLPPKPVLTPYTLCEVSTFPTMTSRDFWMPALISGESSKTICALCLATATSAGMERLWPSMTIELPCLSIG